MGILKDLYGGYDSDSSGRNGKKTSNCIQRVCVVWVVPQKKDAAAFASTFGDHIEASKKHQRLPTLDLRIHVTRSKKTLRKPLYSGRPVFPKILNELSQSHSGASTLIFACGPGGMVNTLWDEAVARNSKHQLVTFHHEVFEF
eukprot:m.36239 g.36239  ORF g.36239 m.36239 type:complete len:143 (+) comp9058_c0_seq1:362-790(+)